MMKIYLLLRIFTSEKSTGWKMRVDYRNEEEKWLAIKNGNECIPVESTC